MPCGTCRGKAKQPSASILSQAHTQLLDQASDGARAAMTSCTASIHLIILEEYDDYADRQAADDQQEQGQEVAQRIDWLTPLPHPALCR